MVSVIIPALNESNRIGGVVDLALNSPSVSEVIVVDDGSIDDTGALAARAGARVITSSLLGKGASMEDGLRAAANEIVVYLDGDLHQLQLDLIENLVRPIVEDRADFAKARFSRAAGRVTTLTARPLLQLFFPELAHFVQPLGGIMAARTSLLERLKFETDYGVDLGLLIDAHMQGARIEEVDIGHLEHESQTLEALGEMSKQVVRTLLNRADRHGRFSVAQIREVEELERHAGAEFEVATQKVKNVNRLAVFDMDGTLIRGRFIVELAKRCGLEDELAQFLDNTAYGTEERSHNIAKLFDGVPRTLFEEVAREVELTPDAAETVVSLRKLGFTVGIVTDSYRVAAEIVRRRVFADFSVANMIRFRNGKACGEYDVSPLLSHPDGCRIHSLCKQNVVLHMIERFGITDNQVLAVGDGLNDACMLSAAGLSIAFEPKNEQVSISAQHTILHGLPTILDWVREKGWAETENQTLVPTTES